MLLQESRRAARTSPSGDLVLLEEQDRMLWDRGMIGEGLALVERALRSRRFGPYTIQAAIAAVHAEAVTPGDTDWAQIVGLYDLLLRIEPAPVVELNRALAIAMRDGPAAGLALIDGLLERGDLARYHLAHAARGELCRRLGRHAEARAAYGRALALPQQEPERRFLQRRLGALGDRSRAPPEHRAGATGVHRQPLSRVPAAIRRCAGPSCTTCTSPSTTTPPSNRTSPRTTKRRAPTSDGAPSGKRARRSPT
jgi:predicted RNA polymerase sigma factor